MGLFGSLGTRSSQHFPDNTSSKEWEEGRQLDVAVVAALAFAVVLALPVVAVLLLLALPFWVAVYELKLS